MEMNASFFGYFHDSSRTILISFLTNQPIRLVFCCQCHTIKKTNKNDIFYAHFFRPFWSKEKEKNELNSTDLYAVQEAMVSDK